MRDRLSYSSLFSYVPERRIPLHPWDRRDEAKTALEFMRCLKNNWPYSRGSSSIEPSKVVAQILVKNLSHWRSVFHGDVVLVPVPRSAPIRKNDLWPPFLIAEEMQKAGLGRVLTLLERVERVNPSSRSLAKERPSPKEHFESIRLLELSVVDVKNVILVDDLVTRGHTFMGCAWKIDEAYPNVGIHAFAAIRTISNPEEFKGFYDPVEQGMITYRRDSDDCLRRP